MKEIEIWGNPAPTNWLVYPIESLCNNLKGDQGNVIKVSILFQRRRDLYGEKATTSRATCVKQRNIKWEMVSG